MVFTNNCQILASSGIHSSLYHRFEHIRYSSMNFIYKEYNQQKHSEIGMHMNICTTLALNVKGNNVKQPDVCKMRIVLSANKENVFDIIKVTDENLSIN
ncbi:Hypothetical predicted protein [Octopus vulgaris]|nr:Hypothetical predicted protein [Octopus vulgaris]